uniref:Uncharacterized protein n=1 Tax=Cacopsylla melanoneura TaxID=428564 RepID=A0A8D8TVA2_9HEMI
MKPRDLDRMFLVTLLVIGLLTMVQSKTDNLVRRQLDPYTQEKLQEEIKTKIEPLLEKKLQEIVNMPGNQELSKSQIRYLLQQSIKKIQPERFYVDKNEQAKNPSFIGYLSTEDAYVKPEEKDVQDPKDHFTLPVNFHIPTTKRSDDLATSSQQYPDQLYHQQQFVQTPNNNNGYPQPQLIQNYPNILPLPPNTQQQNPQIPQNYVQQPVQNYAPPQQNVHNFVQQPVQNPNFVQQPVQNYAPAQQNVQNFVQPEQSYVQTPQGNPQYLGQPIPQQYLTQQQYQNLLAQNQNLLAQNQQLNQPYTLSAQNQQFNPQNFAQPQNQQLNAPGSDLPIIKPTTIPLAIPILQRFLERPQQQPLPEQLNIQQPQQPVPLPPQLYYNQQQGAPINGYVPQQIQQQQFQPQPIQQNQANGISLRADLKDNLFPDNEDQRYQQPVFSINEPPPPAEQQIENPPQQQGNIAQKYPLGPSGYANQQQNQFPVNVQNLPLVNTQPVYSGQQISQGINQGAPYYSAQTYPQQGVPNQYGPQGPIPNYQDEQQQYDRPQEQYNAQNRGNGGGDPNQGQDQTTEAPIKYNINDELPPISNFQDLLKPPSPVNQERANIPPDNSIPPQQYLQYRNNNPPPATPDRLIYTTPNPQKFDDRVAGLRPSIQEMDPLLRGDPGYKPTGKPSPVITGLRDFNIIPIDLIHRNDSDTKLKYDLPNDLFTLPVHFATPNKTVDYQKQRLEEKLKQNAQNIQSLYDLQQSNNQNNINDKNSNIITRNELLKRDHSSKGKITTKVDETIPSKPRSKRNYYYDTPKTPFNLPGETDPYGTPSHPYNTPSDPYGTPSHPFSTPLYYENIEYRYIPIYIPKPTDFFFIIRFCPVTIGTPNHSHNTTGGTQNMTTAAVDTATQTTTSTPTTETMTTLDMATATTPGSNDTNTPPNRCVWAIVSCCSPGMIDQRSQCFQVLGCQGDLSDTPCAPDVVMNAVQQVNAFYQNTSDALLREDRKQKVNDADYDYDGGSNLNQLFYDDFEVPDNITVSPDTLTTLQPVSSEATRVVRLVASPTKPTPKPPAKPIAKAAPKPPVKPIAKAAPKPTAKSPVKAPVKGTVKPATPASTTKRSIKRETLN